MNENVDIFIYAHKPFKPLVTNKVYKILTNTHKDFEDTKGLDLIRDYEGDNIGDLNVMYNEYTGFYWLWKNYQIKDYIGLIHYDRYYTFMDDIPNISEIMSKYPIILSKPIPLIHDGKRWNNRDWYEHWHNIDDFGLIEYIIKSEYPEYTTGFDRMSNAPFIHNSNMFIMTKQMFNEYCEFVFAVLKKFRDYRGFNTIDDCTKYVEEHSENYIRKEHWYYNVFMQSRIVGYLAERVLNTFLMNGSSPLTFEAALFEFKDTPRN